MFQAGNKPEQKILTDNNFTVSIHDEIETVNSGWKTPDKLVLGTDLITDGEECALITNVVKNDEEYTIYFVDQPGFEVFREEVVI